MTEQELKEFMEENKLEIQQKVKTRIIEKLMSDYRWEISERMKTVVDEFVDEHVIPAVREELSAQKQSLVDAAVQSCAGIGDELAKALSKKAAENLSYGFKVDEIAQKLFR